MKEHKHAAVLRAIADGVPLCEFEVRNKDWDEDDWVLLEIYLVESLIFYEEWEVRRKQQFITVNGLKVPKPVDSDLRDGDLCFHPSVTSGTFYDSITWGDFGRQKMLFSRGLIHKTKEAATAHAKAMLGIDPESNHE